MALAMLASAAMPAFAQQVGVDEAMQSARKFLSGSRTAKARAKANIPMKLAYTAEQNGKAHFYVFNSEAQDGGFVIVGGDMAAKEILGYCESGSFDYATAPDNMKWWLSQYDAQIAEGIKQGVNMREAEKKLRKVSPKTQINPILSTQWGQGEPFNRQIPVINSTAEKFVTGCVATATCQIMKHYEYPTTGVGSNNYSKIYDGSYNVIFSANFATGNYDWANMKDTYASGTYTDAEANAVAKLLYHVGVALNMDYGRSSVEGEKGSGSNTYDVPKVLINNFSYDKSAHYLQRSYYTDEEWEQAIYDELRKGRAIIYDGHHGSAGHAFICHGYNSSSNTFTINWGWNGYCDGDFTLTGSNALQSAGGQYEQSQAAIVDIKPDEGGDYYREMRWTGTIGTSLSTVERGTDFRLIGNITNSSPLYEFTNVLVGAKLTNVLTSEVVYQPANTINIEAGSSYTLNQEYFDIHSNAIPEGTYEVIPVYSLNGGADWTEVLVPSFISLPQMTITTSSAEYLITTTPTVGNGGYAIGEGSKLKIYFNVKNNSASPITKTFMVPVWEKGGSSSSIYAPSKTVNISAGEEITVVMSYDDKAEYHAGAIYFFDIRENTIPIWPNVYFNAVNEKAIPYTLTDAGWGTLILPFEAEIPSGLTAYTCESLSGSTLNLTPATKIEQFTPYIIAGTPGSYNFAGPDVPGENTYVKGLLKGVNGTYALQAADYIMQKQGSNVAFYLVGSGAKSGTNAEQYRCVLNSGLSLSMISFPEVEITGVNGIANESNEIKSIYSISGVRQSGMQKGINIIRLSDGRVMKVLTK